MQRVCTKDGEVRSVVTDKGSIKCKYFVNAGGMVSKSCIRISIVVNECIVASVGARHR